MVTQKIKRFRIFDYERYILFKGTTTRECYDFIKNKLDLRFGVYWIEDVVDDIELPVREFFEAFEEGECPGDLQFF